MKCLTGNVPIETDISSDNFANISDINKNITNLTLLFNGSSNNSYTNNGEPLNETPHSLTNENNYNNNVNSYEIMFVNAMGTSIGLSLSVTSINDIGEQLYIREQTDETWELAKYLYVYVWK